MGDSTALGIFRIIAPEFQAVKDEVVEKYLVITEPFVSKSKFGRVYEQALALLVAHRMKLPGWESLLLVASPVVAGPPQ